MAMIRMDLDQAESTISSFGSAIGNLGSELSTLTSAVQALLGAWEGSAQVQFDNSWMDWSSRFQTAIQELEPMMSGLRTEREQIMEADASSNFA